MPARRAGRTQGFNLRLQRTVRNGARGGARPAGIHLVAPSVWAFRGADKRAAALAQCVDELLCILPFEPPLLVRLTSGDGRQRTCLACACMRWLAKQTNNACTKLSCALPTSLQTRHGVAATFVGHPVLEECTWRDGEWHADAGGQVRAPEPRSSEGPLLCVLPGSRTQEVARHMPLFGASLHRAQQSDACVVFASC
jgi:lipid-A-disaccharide synthase